MVNKKELEERHLLLVRELMTLWMAEHRMEDWIEPLRAVRQMQTEAFTRQRRAEKEKV